MRKSGGRHIPAAIVDSRAPGFVAGSSDDRNDKTDLRPERQMLLKSIKGGVASLLRRMPGRPFATRPFNVVSLARSLKIAPYFLAGSLLPAFCFLYGLGAYPLLDLNEGLYAEISREMLETGQVVVPHLLGVPYIEKPPLLYWLMALSFHAFGPSAASARLVSAAPMLLLALAIPLVFSRLGHQRAGLYATLVLSTSVAVVLISRTVLFDPLLTALLSGCFLAFLQWYLDRRQSRLMLSALLLALATMEKGGVAIALAGGVIGTFLILMQDLPALRAVFDKAAIGLFLALTVPWHIAAALQQDGFAWFYFMNEHLLRYVGLREPHDYHLGPPYYYIPKLLILLLPWTPLLALLVRSPVAREPHTIVIERFCKAWILFPFLFFSLSQAKAEYYILVIAPACALLIGMELERRLSAGTDKLLSHCLGFSMALAAALLWVALHAERVEHVSPDAIMVAFTGLAMSAAAWYLTARWLAASREQRWLRETAVLGVGLVVIPVLVAILQFLDGRSVHKSSRHVADAIQWRAGIAPMVFVYRDYEDVLATLPFYLGQKVKVIDSWSQDLEFGCGVTTSHDKACISSKEFAYYRAQFPVAVVVHESRLDEFRTTAGQGVWKTIEAGEKWVFFNR
jgi:4-amino-4-deoxy-L-arabinose transferase-like glycosyltransferase